MIDYNYKIYIRRKKNIIIASLCIALVFMGIGYSLLAQNLKINSTGKISSIWSIKMINVEYSASGYAEVASDSPKISEDGHSLKLSTIFKAPNDEIIYTVTVKNEGNIKALLKSIEYSGPTTTDYIKVTDTITSALEINPEEEITFDVKVRFKDISSLPEGKDKTFTLTITPIYTQLGDTEIYEPGEDDWLFKIDSNGVLTDYNYASKMVDDTLIVEVPSNVTSISKTAFQNYNVALFSATDLRIKASSEEEYNQIKTKASSAMRNMCYDSGSDTYDSDCLSQMESMISAFREYGVDIPDGSQAVINVDLENDIVDFVDSEPANVYMVNYEGIEIIDEKNFDAIKEKLLALLAAECSSDDENYQECVAQAQSAYTIYRASELGNAHLEIQQTLLIDPDPNTSLENSMQEGGSQIKSLDLSNATNLETIESETFSNSPLENLILPEGLKYIEDNSFSNTNLKTVVIPDSVEEIGDSAFSNNSELSSVTFGTTSTQQTNNLSQKYSINKMTNKVEKMSTTFNSNLKRIGNSAFSGCNLSGKLVLPDNGNLTSIEGYSFSNNAITSVDIPKSVTNLGSYAFGYNQISTLTVSTSSEADAFYNNPITNLTLTDCNNYCGSVNSTSTINQLTIKSGSIKNDVFYDKSIQKLTLEEGVTSIGSSAFSLNQISELTIPSSVTSIGSSAFCVNQITELTIPSGVVTIGYSAFSNQTDSAGNVISINKLIIEEYKNGYNINAFDNIINLTINGGDISKEAFRERLIQNLMLGNDVVNIGVKAFSENQINELTIPSNVTTVGDYAFFGNQISKLDLTDATSLQSIGCEAFSSNQLTELTISSSVTTVGDYAFFGNQISELIIPLGVISIGDYSFCENQINMLIIEEYKSGYNINAFDNIINLTINSGEISNYAFQRKSIQSLILGEGVTSIGDWAFEQNQIGELKITSGVTCVGGVSFGNNKIKALDLTDAINLKNIEVSAFSNNQISELTIPSNVINIGNQAFYANQINLINIERSEESWKNDVTLGNNWYGYAKPIFNYNYVILNN
ncbi:MAG: leucine-rich repeat domain-containing protein [bacterium]|nr:leucine-rich repeat domain-containing protein [bacterium]